MDASERLVSVSEAAEILGISAEAVRKRIHRHTLPATKWKGQWLIRIDEYLADIEGDPPGSAAVRKYAVQDDGRGRQDAETTPVLPSMMPDVTGWQAVGEHLLAPLVEQMLEMQAENARLRERVAELEDAAPDGIQDDDEAPWWRRWLGLT